MVCFSNTFMDLGGAEGVSIPWQTCTAGLVDKALTYWIRRKRQAEHVLNNYTHSDKQRAVIGCVREEKVERRTVAGVRSAVWDVKQAGTVLGRRSSEGFSGRG